MAASLSISDAGMILFMELIETDVVVLRGGMQRDRDMDKPEGYSGFRSQ